MAYAHGIDVSNHNGAFPWEDYPDIDFAFIKAVELTPQGMYYDTQFPRNMQVTAEHYHRKLVRHPYCFAHPGASLMPQVHALVGYANDHGMLDGDHYMMDLEVNDGLSPAQVSKFGAEFCHQVNRLGGGRRCIDYTFLAFAQEGNCEGQWPWRLFIADWDVKAPTVPQPWAGRGLAWKYWQFARGVEENGVVLPDLDVFHGDRAALMDFCRMPASRR